MTVAFLCFSTVGHARACIFTLSPASESRIILHSEFQIVSTKCTKSIVQGYLAANTTTKMTKKKYYFNIFHQRMTLVCYALSFMF